MITTVYFIRHAEPDYSVHDDMIRPLTDKGLGDAERLPEFFADIEIDKVISSPFHRAYQTVEPIATNRKLDVELLEDFRERKVSGEGWIEDFSGFAKNQWHDFDFRMPGGDSLREVQERNIRALKKVITDHEGSNIIVGSHGTALSTIINFFDNTFGYEEFNQVKGRMPWIVKFTFKDGEEPEIESMN